MAVLLPAVGIEPTSPLLRRKPYTTRLPKYLSNSISLDIEIEKEVHVWVGQQFDNFGVFFLVWVFYKKNLLEPFPTPSHTISWQVCFYISFFLFFRSWVAKTPPNHLAKRLVSTRLTM